MVGSGNLCLDRSLWKHQSPLKQTLKLKAAKGEQVCTTVPTTQCPGDVMPPGFVREMA